METWTDFFGNKFAIGDTIYFWPSTCREWRKSIIENVLTEKSGTRTIIVEGEDHFASRASYYASISNRKLLSTEFKKGDHVFFKTKYRQVNHGTVYQVTNDDRLVIHQTHTVKHGTLTKLNDETYGNMLKIKTEYTIKIRDGISTAIETLRNIEKDSHED
jgi:hypothetical protein